MYDIIIIGGGPAGISASLYTFRAGLSTLIIAHGKGSLEKAEKIENYYGIGSELNGGQLIDNGIEQAEKLGVEIIDDEVVGIKGFDEMTLQCIGGEYIGKALIIAMGSPRKKLPFKNIEKFEGNGISYCAACDGFFYRDRKIAVIGYNEYMVHEAVEIRELSDNLTILTNGMPLEIEDADNGLIDGIAVDSEKIEDFYGDDYLLGIEFESGRKEDFEGVFIAYGSATGMEMALKTGLLTEDGIIVADEKQCTNLPNIFAAGDCTGGFKQVSVAVGEGAVAAKSAIEYVRSTKQ